ncbi:hypothetical protein E0W68_03090 [Flavobacterium salilacus subsp. salilacus]|nr:hypothetical protein E0W68_03090 [Flavobacterium salilacus subsp. salilacus]MBE1614761.1 hypothetical protein [Flavobacterium sp. SaA2.13]
MENIGFISGPGYNYNISIISNNLYILGDGNLYNLPFYTNFFATVNYSIDYAVLQGLCYIYYYDIGNRIIAKHIPDNGWTHIVYDKRDRPILIQDENLRIKNGWLFTKYDTFDRVAYTGEYYDNRERKTIQNDVNDNTVFNEAKTTTSSFTSGGSPVYYSNIVFPTQNLVANPETGGTALNLFTINYYDNYTFNTGVNIPSTNWYNKSISSRTKGLQTGSKIRVLGTDWWSNALNAYDDKGRVVWSHTEDGYNYSGRDTNYNLSFTGQVLESKDKFSHFTVNGAVSVDIEDYYTYDYAERLLEHKQKINDNPTELISSNIYDDLGQLIRKGVGGKATATTPLQTVNYNYNIRGWLKGINNVEQGLSATSDLFAFGVNYTNVTASPSIGLQAEPLYNGNIAETLYRSKSDDDLKVYAYKYDVLNRLTEANLFGAPGVTGISDYREGGIVYDKNGNILNLERYGITSTGNFDKIDVLSYTYKPHSNRLIRVDDYADTEGFNDGDTGSPENQGEDDYRYDDNGNMNMDLNKGIVTEGITYNHLNLPVHIDFGNNNAIEYVYDAAGTKLEKKVTENSTVTKTTYTNGFVYKNDVLQFLPHPEGYASYNENNENFSYVYQYKDHLGNVRLSYTDAVQEEVDIPFDTDLGGFTEQENAAAQLQNGALVVNVTEPYAGVRKGISTSVSKGERYEFTLTIDKGTTNSVSVVIRESDPSEGVWEEFSVGYLSPGQQTLHFEHTVSADNLGLSLYIRKTGVTQVTTTFSVLHFNYKKKKLEVIEEDHYYPFGLKHKIEGAIVQPIGNAVAQNYKYNGKEFTEALGLNMYDLGARMYMPDIGRFGVVDPMADFVNYQSPYVASDNNPVLYRDEYGLGILNVIGNFFSRIGNGIARLFSGNNCGCYQHPESYADSWSRMDFPKINEKLRNLFDRKRSSTKSKSEDDGENDDRKPVRALQVLPIDPFSMKIPIVGVIHNPPPIKGMPNPIVNGREIKSDGRTTFDADIKFANSSTSLDNSSAHKTLKNLIKTLVDYPQLTILIHGNASFITSESIDSNTGAKVDGQRGTIGQLQLGRARAIEAYLIRKGINPSRIRVTRGKISTNGSLPSATFTVKN